MPNVPKTYRVKIKGALKTSDFNVLPLSFCIDLILPIWIKFLKNYFVYFEFEIFHF